MKFHELRSTDAARGYLLAGLAMTRVIRWNAEAVRPALQWLLEIAAEGHPAPPPGFVVDVGTILFGSEASRRAHQGEPLGWSAGPVRRYEDFVISRLLADRSIDRATDALRRLSGRDRARGLAFLLERLRERVGLGGVGLSPGPIRGLLDVPPGELVNRSWEAVANSELHPILAEQYDELTLRMRLAGDLLGPEDVFELERGTALADLGQRVAIRQVIRTASELAASLPATRPTPLDSQRLAATRLRDDDAYPVGGFSSLTNRGSTESLLHSQLAFMETDPEERPDLFDVKFLRDELLYYARDENQFYRRRRKYRVHLDPSLAGARWKDPEASVQRVIFAIASVVAVVRQVIHWLAEDALTFELVFPRDNSLEPELDIFKAVFTVEIETGTVRVGATEASDVVSIAVATESIPDVPTLVVAQRPKVSGLDSGNINDDATVMQAWAGVTHQLACYFVDA